MIAKMPSLQRLFVRGVPLLLLVLLIHTFWTWRKPSAAPGPIVDYYRPGEEVQPDDKEELVPMMFDPLPVGVVKPEGWMKDQMVAMASGLPGHLGGFYNYVAKSSWLGGTEEYSGLNEGFPYWFNGIVPLAYQLDDERLKHQVHTAADYILDNQYEDGWIGPENGSARILWGRFPACLGLIQLVEANSTYETKVVPALHKFAELMHAMLIADYSGYRHRQDDGHDEDTFMWGRVRYADMILTLQWLYEKYPRKNANLLVENMRILHDGGLDWAGWYTEKTYIKDNLYNLPEKVTKNNYHFLHAVNVGQGLKHPAIIRRFTRNDSLLVTAYDAVRWTFKHHGSASGTIIGDERIDGLAAWSGSELCTTVETMYSLSYLYHATGFSDYADRAERAAFNALPAMISPDWWSHQYVAQTNQPFSRKLLPNPFFNTNPISNTFGLEPHYPCCTVNHHQGFPKYLSNSWVRMGANGIGHALLGPSSLEIKLLVGHVTIKCTTNYPFSGKLYYTINTPGPFDLYVRVPQWATDRSFYIKDSVIPFALRKHPDTGMHRIPISYRGVTTVIYDLKANIITHPRANDTVTVNHGALLYAFEVDAKATAHVPKAWGNMSEYSSDYAPAKSRDWVITNTTPWNIAIDVNTLQGFSVLDNTDGVREQAPLKHPVFAPGGPPTWMTVKACEIEWPMLHGPNSPPGPVIPADQRRCIGEVFFAKLVPYGSAKLHMAELPTIDLSDGSPALPSPPPDVDPSGGHAGNPPQAHEPEDGQEGEPEQGEGEGEGGPEPEEGEPEDVEPPPEDVPPPPEDVEPPPEDVEPPPEDIEPPPEDVEPPPEDVEPPPPEAEGEPEGLPPPPPPEEGGEPEEAPPPPPEEPAAPPPEEAVADPPPTDPLADEVHEAAAQVAAHLGLPPPT